MDRECSVGEVGSILRCHLVAVLAALGLHVRLQSGISPARGTSEIFLFTGNHSLFGYADEPLPDGRYRYSGEGLHRDQEMTRGNRAILEHAENGNRLRLLRTLGGGMVEYLGEYEYETHRMLQRQDPTTLESLQHIEFTLREVHSNQEAKR